ncbi:YkvA family protein [Xanthobacter sp. TB0136]|uniref:YkvA family protein n=1 Tax=Xanthobacter sp. TB0136 TaxID=3459177 RepID=UPI00403A3270
MLKFIRQRFVRFRKEAVVLWFAMRDPQTPRSLRIASIAVALYLLSPLDLIPFTIPVLGVVDDLIIVPLAVAWICRRLPMPVQARAQGQASLFITRWFKYPLLALAVIVIALVLVWAGLLWLLWRWWGG